MCRQAAGRGIASRILDQLLRPGRVLVVRFCVRVLREGAGGVKRRLVRRVVPPANIGMAALARHPVLVLDIVPIQLRPARKQGEHGIVPLTTARCRGHRVVLRVSTGTCRLLAERGIASQAGPVLRLVVHLASTGAERLA